MMPRWARFRAGMAVHASFDQGARVTARPIARAIHTAAIDAPNNRAALTLLPGGEALIAGLASVIFAPGAMDDHLCGSCYRTKGLCQSPSAVGVTITVDGTASTARGPRSGPPFAVEKSRALDGRCAGLDRKSTRLNSSHLGIPYA